MLFNSILDKEESADQRHSTGEKDLSHTGGTSVERELRARILPAIFFDLSKLSLLGVGEGET